MIAQKKKNLRLENIGQKTDRSSVERTTEFNRPKKRTILSCGIGNKAKMKRNFKL